MTQLQIAEAQSQRALDRWTRANIRAAKAQSILSELALNVERLRKLVVIRKARANGDTTSEQPGVSTTQRDEDSVKQEEGGAPSDIASIARPSNPPLQADSDSEEKPRFVPRRMVAKPGFVMPRGCA